MKVIAHRGASASAPENTLAAIRQAWKEGADGVELDTRQSADGVPMMVHDVDLQRVAGDERKVAELTAETLQQIDVGRYKGEAFCGETMPTLRMALSEIPAEKDFLLELKEGAESAIAVMEALEGPMRNLYLQSFYPETLHSVRQLSPATPLILLLPDSDRVRWPDVIETALELQCVALGLARTWLQEPTKLTPIRQAGLELSFWTIDQPEEARLAKRLGAQWLTSNRPGELSSLLRGS